MTRRLLVFDLDGTLIDSRQDLTTAVNLMRRHYGLGPLSVETVSSYVGDGVRKLVERALQGFPADLDEAIGIQGRFYRRHLADQTTLYPGVAEGLLRLHAAGHHLALATNKPTDACERILQHFGLRHLFCAVLGGGSGTLKPDPAMILHIMSAVGAEPADTWMVGDNVTDLQAARLAGVQSAFMTYGFGTEAGETPTLRFSSFTELVDAFAAAHPASPIGPERTPA